MRGFAIFLGATAPAAAAALAAFFVGFGFGSYLLGRFAPRLRRPLRAFALLEIITGASAVAVEPLLRATPPVLTWLSDAAGDSAALQLAVKVALAIASVLIPATAMGGTLPVLAQFVAPRGESLGVRSGGLYAVNMCGACAGALAVPAVLLPAIGATGALGAAITINFLVAAGAVLLDRSNEPAKLEPSPPVQGSRPSRETLILAAVSGGITLALEALGSRAFALIHENSVYSFATVVAVLLAGLASGAAAARRALRRRVAPRALASIGWAGAGVWMVVLPALFVRITGLDYVTSARLLAHEAHLALLVGATLLVPGLLLGLLLPALMQEEGELEREGGPAVGAILAANTAGAIAGPLVALFVLVPAAGLWTAVSLLGACSIIAAAFAARGAAGPIRSTVGAAVVVAIVAFFVTEPASLPALKLTGRDQLLHLSEGAFGSVAVVEHDGHRRIKLNNFYVLGGTHAAGDERLQGHIPLLVHPQPQRVAFLGLGTGISFSAIRFHPIREALALELVPEVVFAARDWFGDSNLGVLQDPRARLRAEDARSYVAATRERFDVVVGDLVVPWRRGESSLYTRESFDAVRRVLAPGGLYCQWVPLYQISEAEFDSIAASFLDVFPRTTLWRGDFSAGQAAVALIGHTSPDGLEAAAVDARSQALMANPDRSNPYLSHRAGTWLYFVGPLDAADRRFRSARRNRDANPWIELAGPSLHLRIQSGEARPFIGRPLKDRLEAIRSASLAGTAAASLTPEQIEWRERGAEIWTASLLSFEGDNAAADRLALGAIGRLPGEIQAAVLGPSRK
ncbi:MAG TPA: fused MFS/spermidine synthase [Vicinamibacterales bacterium]|nr:fused MFS/spermidine synthase [Vicinamibacterales bacterium]